MTSDINPDVPPRIRCEAIPPSSTSILRIALWLEASAIRALST